MCGHFVQVFVVINPRLVYGKLSSELVHEKLSNKLKKNQPFYVSKSGKLKNSSDFVLNKSIHPQLTLISNLRMESFIVQEI